MYAFRRVKVYKSVLILTNHQVYYLAQLLADYMWFEDVEMGSALNRYFIEDPGNVLKYVVERWIVMGDTDLTTCLGVKG
jgi:hypothetical protein